MNINTPAALKPVSGLVVAAILSLSAPAFGQEPLFHDSHFHLTNYIQEGTSMPDLVEMMGDTIGRSTVFGLPLQQMWFYGNTGDFAPTYYLQIRCTAVLLLVYRRAHRNGLPGPGAGTAGAARPDDHRL